ncbi:MAG: helix-turn-helix domain-containing protein [Nitrospinota bacterium]
MANVKRLKDRLKILMRGERPYTWAKKAGIKKGLFQYYWQKECVPSYENLIKIQEYTGCSLDWLLTGKVPFGGKLKDLPLVQVTVEKDKSLRAYSRACGLLAEIYSDTKSEKELKALNIVLSKFSPGPGKKGIIKGDNKGG